MLGIPSVSPRHQREPPGVRVNRIQESSSFRARRKSSGTDPGAEGPPHRALGHHRKLRAHGKSRFGHSVARSESPRGLPRRSFRHQTCLPQRQYEREDMADLCATSDRRVSKSIDPGAQDAVDEPCKRALAPRGSGSRLGRGSSSNVVPRVVKLSGLCTRRNGVA